MKILFVITGLGVGGAEYQVTALADRLEFLGHNVTIAYLTGYAEVLPISANVRIVPFHISKNILGGAIAYFKLRRLIRSIVPDVVHSHMVHANLLSRLVRLTIAFPRLVSTAHSSFEGGRLRMSMYRLTDYLADVSTNVSQEAVSNFEFSGAVPSGRMIPVYNGLDCSKFKPDEDIRRKIRHQMCVDDHERLILCVGRLVDAKNYPNLLKAFASIRPENSSTKLLIAGDGPLHKELEAMVNHFGLKNFVSFLGIRKDIPDLMRAADIFALSSSWEGFGLVVAEAMATERVVVATDCGGVREVVGDCGFLVPTDDTEALARGLQRALDMSPEEALTLGRRARKRVLEKFSLESVTNRWLEIYGE